MEELFIGKWEKREQVVVIFSFFFHVSSANFLLRSLVFQENRDLHAVRALLRFLGCLKLLKFSRKVSNHNNSVVK